MKIETWLIANLTLDPNNARKHDQRNLDAIMTSLEKFGQRKPIVVTTDGVVLAGNGTVAAAQGLGWKDISVAVAPKDWDSDTAKAYALADNRSAELAEWDNSVLASQLIELDTAGWDIGLLGFDTPEPDEKPITEELDEIPNPVDDPITQPGYVWKLGRHRLHCGDSTTDQAFQTVMQDELADLIVTDPPYGVSYVGGHNDKKREMIANDDVDVFAESIPLGYVYSKPSAALYCWFAGAEGHLAFDAVLRAGYKVRTMIIWNKLKAHYGAFMSQYMPKKEPILYCFKLGESAKWRGPTNEIDVWEYDQPARNEWHPTQKPVEVMARAIRNSSDVNDVVLDFFGGSGSTLIAAEQTNRQARLIEIDPKYCDVIVKRWEQLTGHKAELVTE